MMNRNEERNTMSKITRWDPVRDLISMSETMDQLLNDRFSRVAGTEYPALLPVDAYATDDALVLLASVPGLKPDELSVTYEDGTLTIQGALKPATDEKNYLLRERVTGRFERTLKINTPIDSDKIEATFENGVLTLKLPKAEAVKPRQIAIKTISSN
jgi:HSP20 family protein